MRLKRVPTGQINPAPYNPRKDLKPDDKEYQHLVKSLDEFGCVQPLVWNNRTGHLVGGHQRFKVLLARGVQDVEVSVVELDLDKEKALNLALNKVSGQWDNSKLAEILDELLKAPGILLESTGFTLPETEQILADVLNDKGLDEDPDASYDATLPAVTQPGDLIELGQHGEHRILCGDAIQTPHLSRLMDGFRAQMCHADPPYGVKYDRANRPALRKSGKGNGNNDAIRNDDLTPKRYASWFAKVVECIGDNLISGGPFYVWNGHRNFGLMHDLLSAGPFKVASVITWAKESFSPGFGDYNEHVEYCLYGWKSGTKHRWYGPANESTLWQIHRDRTQLYCHPTQKPLELAERAVRNSSKRGDIVFDPFLGSGTTLMAAARLGRRCFGLEIEPKHCDSIVRRYMALVGPNSVSSDLRKRYGAKEVSKS